MVDESRSLRDLGHEWVRSTLGHGESMCKHCRMTNREAAVLGELGSDCDRRVQAAQKEEES